MQVVDQRRIISNMFDKMLVVFSTDGLDQAFLLPLQDHAQMVGIGGVLFVAELLAIEKIILLIASNFQNGAVEFLGQFEKLHGAGKAAEIVVIDGDDNRNAAVAVQYHKKGTASWKEALPLLRLQNEEAGGSLTPAHVVPNMFAGSILDLEPDTEYECRLQMSDPDGVDGNKQKIVTVRTRPEPKPFRP